MNQKSSSHFLRLLSKATQKFIPFCVSIELTQACNFKCQHCYHPAHSSCHRLTEECARDLLLDLKTAGTLEVAFTGGEVLLHPDWEPILRQSRNLGFQARVLTNGSLVDEKVARTLRELYVGVEVSLYSTDPSTYETITGVSGSFQKVKAGIEMLVDQGVDVSIKMPICNLNVSHVDSVAEFCEAKGVHFAAYATLFPKTDGTPLTQDLNLNQKQMATFLSGPHGYCSVPSGQQKLDDNRPLCAAGVRYAFVDATGEVYACNLLPQSAGNITSESFTAIWKHAKVLQRLRRIRKPDLKTCGTCDDLATCGRCHALALLEKGDLLGPSDSACRRAEAMRGRSTN